MNLKDITIIIPTHNREGYLKRILDYYSNKSVKIIICDSSDKGFQIKKRHNVTYHYYKGYEHKSIEKLISSLSKVKTKYVVLCADDDFIIPQALEKCINFLEKNKDYSSAQGQIVEFINKNKKLTFSPTFMNFINVDINSDSVPERLYKLFDNYVYVLYSVHNTAVFKKILTLCQEKIKVPFLVEYSFNILSSIEGKHKVLPVFYTVKEINFSSMCYSVDNLDIITKNKKYWREFNDFIKANAGYLSKKEGISLNKSIKIINNTINIRKKFFKKLNLNPKIRILKLCDKISKKLGNKLREFNFYSKRLLNIPKTKKIKGYPFYDLKEKKELKEISFLIKKYNIKN